MVLAILQSHTSGLSWEQRPRKTTIGRDSPRHRWLGHHFQGQKVKGQGYQAALLSATLTCKAAAAWERIRRAKELLPCVHRSRIWILQILKCPKIHDFYEFENVNFKIHKIQIITFIAANSNKLFVPKAALNFWIKNLWCQQFNIC